MMFLQFLVIGFAIENDAFAIRNSHVGFSNQRPTVPAMKDYRSHSNAAKVFILSAAEETNSNDNNNKKDASTDAELFLLEYSIDSFLRGEYERTFSEDAAAPFPGLSPSDTVDEALRSLRDLDEPEPSHGAAVFLRFCAELGKGERWGTSGSASPMWTELLRGALTPTMLARRIRASEEFSSLLDWKRLEVASVEGSKTETAVFRNVNVACVKASLFFDESSSSPDVYRFNLAKMLGGVWLIESVQKEKSSLAATKQPGQSKNPQRPIRKNRENGGPSRRGRQQRGKQRGDPGKPKFGNEDNGKGNTGKKRRK